MGKVKIKEVYQTDPNNHTLDPILIRFQHGKGTRDSSSIDLNEIFKTAVFQNDPNKSSSSMKDFSHLNRSKNQNGEVPARVINTRKRQLVALQSSSMTYIGTNNDQEPLRTYFALRQGKRMKVYEVSPITVAPFIKGHSFLVEPEKETQVKKSKLEKKEAGIDLIKSFGSKKKRLAYERLEKNQISVADMNESMTKASQQIKAPDVEPQIKDESVLTLIPPCNRDARIPEDVYKLDNVITQEEMQEMDYLADEFLNLSPDLVQEWKSCKKFSDYFFAMWNRLSCRKSDKKAIYCAKLVLYTELLICLLKLRHEQIRKKILDIPDIFPMWMQEKALETFTTVNAKGMRNRADALKDKTCCYVIVLVLLANDFIFDVQLMSTSLNLHIKKLLTLAKAVGITVHYNTTTKENRGVLKLPLPKAIETRGRRRGLR